MHSEVPERSAERRKAEAAPPPPLQFGSVSLELFWALVDGTLPAGLYAAEAAAQALREGGRASGEPEQAQSGPAPDAAAVVAAAVEAGRAVASGSQLLSLPSKFTPGSWMVRAHKVVPDLQRRRIAPSSRPARSKRVCGSRW